MRKSLIISFLAAALILGAAIPVSAQDNSHADKVLKFNETVHDFGDFSVSDGAVSFDFVFTNLTNKPIALTNVVSSCGCTVPSWTKEPVAAGKTGTISVTFNNTLGPFPFDKTLTVYVTQLSKPVVIRIKGDVHEGKLSLQNLFTETRGGFAVKKNTQSVGYLIQGQRKVEDITVANISGKPVKVELADHSPQVSISISPNPIPAKSKAVMKVTVNTAAGEIAWGKTEYYATFKVDGKSYSEKFNIAGVIRDDTSKYSDNAAGAPAPVLEKKYCEFGTVKPGTKIDASLTITNKGKDDLKIYKVESEMGHLTTGSTMPVVIKGGQKGSVKLTFDTAELSGDISNVLTIITNSPSKPMIHHFVTGKVVK